MRAVVDRRVEVFGERTSLRRADTHRDEVRGQLPDEANRGRWFGLIGGWLVLIGLAGCQSVGFSAGIGSDPGGAGSDISSASPARTSRTGQSYGRSGRARLKGSDSAARGSATASAEDEASPRPGETRARFARSCTKRTPRSMSVKGPIHCRTPTRRRTRSTTPRARCRSHPMIHRSIVAPAAFRTDPLRLCGRTAKRKPPS